jgi:hypothetical protein
MEAGARLIKAKTVRMFQSRAIAQWLILVRGMIGRSVC